MTHDAKEVLKEAQTVHEQFSDTLRPVADWFHENEGELFERQEAVNSIADDLSMDETLVGETIAQLVSDTVDPIVQVPTRTEQYVGIVEFHEFDGAYGYIEYDDVIGERRRVVCQACVNQATYDENVTHATEKSRSPESSTYNQEADYDTLLGKVHNHYASQHDSVPESIETGASLASPSTIGGNTVSPDSTNSAHHSRYSDSEAANAMSSQGDISLGGSDLVNVTEVRDSGTVIRIDDGSSRVEFEDTNGNRTTDILANRIYIDRANNWFEGNHDDLASVGSSDHHSRYSNSEARTAVDGANVNISGDADTVDGKDASQLSAAKLGYYDVGSSATASSGGNRTVRVSGSAYFNLPDGGDATVTLKLIKNNNIIESTSTSRNSIFRSNFTINPPTFTKTVSLNQGDDLDVFVDVNTSGMSGEPSNKSSNLEIAI